ncbi:hypothetical protein [Paenibacillus durus]|uniref:Uncharacterized protein n=1 Tax=Paenibacillus durus ATCC 35681 TaxID=1333534 RepID=A0A0F7FAS8_PAEDU|nr:hypothetical protein [Paenibacillus durus]AKG35263.1 hypothetical protein VK70_12310 [Paenibacillus durus ATCC 35681]
MNLIEVQNEEEAEFVKIIKKRFEKGNVTEGKVYEVKRMYYPDNPAGFVNGEAYIIDDEGKELFGVFNTCKTTLFKAAK